MAISSSTPQQPQSSWPTAAAAAVPGCRSRAWLLQKLQSSTTPNTKHCCCCWAAGQASTKEAEQFNAAAAAVSGIVL
jgi:hypothetical protein